MRNEKGSDLKRNRAHDLIGHVLGESGRRNLSLSLFAARLFRFPFCHEKTAKCLCCRVADRYNPTDVVVTYGWL